MLCVQVSGAGALLAPFLTVTFAGVFTGDVLTSMVRPLPSIEILVTL